MDSARRWPGWSADLEGFDYGVSRMPVDVDIVRLAGVVRLVDLGLQRGRVALSEGAPIVRRIDRRGVSGRLVGPAAFKAVVGSFARPQVGSIPIHSR